MYTCGWLRDVRVRRLQYMSAIFYHNDEQKALAERTMKEEASRQTKNITTKIMPAGEFTEAEE